MFHRLDRLSLTFTPSWGLVRIGRQAVTWGNGLVFNPMDLFNPFAPTAVQRDYKIGEDMAYAQVPIGMAETQLLYLPRRDCRKENIAFSTPTSVLATRLVYVCDESSSVLSAS